MEEQQTEKDKIQLNISLPTSVVEDMDQHIKTKYNSRSAFIALCITERIEADRKQWKQAEEEKK